MKTWKYGRGHWSSAESIYLTEEGELREFSAEKDAEDVTILGNGKKVK